MFRGEDFSELHKHLKYMLPRQYKIIKQHPPLTDFLYKFDELEFSPTGKPRRRKSKLN